MLTSPKIVSTTPEAPYNYFEAYRVEVPTSPRSFVLAPAQESLGVRVDQSRSRLVSRFKSSSSDNYSPITEYYVQYDIESPQQLVCFKNDNINKLALGSCCNSDSDCMSNLCDKETFHVLSAAYRTMNAKKSLIDLRLNVDWPTGCQHHFIMQNMLVIPVEQFQNSVIKNLYAPIFVAMRHGTLKVRLV